MPQGYWKHTLRKRKWFGVNKGWEIFQEIKKEIEKKKKWGVGGGGQFSDIAVGGDCVLEVLEEAAAAAAVYPSH